jgi:hypothetical protein
MTARPVPVPAACRRGEALLQHSTVGTGCDTALLQAGLHPESYSAIVAISNSGREVFSAASSMARPTPKQFQPPAMTSGALPAVFAPQTNPHPRSFGLSVYQLCLSIPSGLSMLFFGARFFVFWCR